MNDRRTKLVCTAILIVVGCILAFVFTPVQETSAAQGIILDFGDYDISYLGVDDADENPVDSLNELCDYYGFQISWNGDELVSITKELMTYPETGSQAIWKLYVTERGELNWKQYNGSPSDIAIGDYSAVCWGLCIPGDTPTPGVDAMGVNFYGYGQCYRIVSLAPSCTETIAASGAANIIVGADEYSNYPSSVAKGLDDGSIVSVGGYTNPSYEVIAQLNPDMIIGVGDQSVHRSVIDKMRAHGVNCLATFSGDSIKTIMDNTYMIGAATNYYLKSQQTIEQIEDAMDALDNILLEGKSVRSDVMISLSTSKSPWIAGGNTYASDVINRVLCNNIYESESNWVMVNSETVALNDPDFIIIVSSDYGNSDSEYEDMLSSLSAEWRSTKAFKEGNIFMLTGGATDLASRPSTRIAQFDELMCRMLQPGVFTDIDLPHHIGDDYLDYLTYTKELGFDK